MVLLLVWWKLVYTEKDVCRQNSFFDGVPFFKLGTQNFSINKTILSNITVSIKINIFFKELTILELRSRQPLNWLSSSLNGSYIWVLGWMYTISFLEVGLMVVFVSPLNTQPYYLIYFKAMFYSTRTMKKLRFCQWYVFENNCTFPF